MSRLSALLCLVLALGALPSEVTADEPPRPVIVTSGEGLVRGAPDRGYVNFTTETRDRRPKEAQKQNAEAMAAVQQQLRNAGIPPEAIQTLHYDLQPEFDFKDGRQTLRGYVARNTIEVRVDDVRQVGEIIDLSVGSGATAVSGVRFDLKNREALERDALRMAVADARARADAAALGGGVAIERVVRIEEQRSGFQPPQPMMMAMRESAQADTPIAPGQIEIRANVTLTAAIK